MQAAYRLLELSSLDSAVAPPHNDGCLPAGARQHTSLLQLPIQQELRLFCVTSSLMQRPDRYSARRREHDGTLFTAGAMAQVPPLHSWAVCPHSLPDGTLKVLLAAPEYDDFRIVPSQQRVTPAWLHACVRSGRLVPLLRSAPAHVPLPRELPLPGFSGYVITCSSYDKEPIKQLVTLLGGALPSCLSLLYCQDAIQHLIIIHTAYAQP